MDFKSTVQRYYQFSKPGIVYANVLTATAGYLFASKFHIHPTSFVGLLTGLALLIAGACASNNYLDRKLDAHMARTKKRGLVTGDIAAPAAISYAATTTLLGMLLLTFTQNALTFVLGLIAFVDYVILYGYTKRKTVHGTLVGCISGAIPLVAGYTAVSDQLDLTAWLLFGLMVAWQMGHFYGIALYRLQDYKAGHIPVMPAVYGENTTKRQVIGYIILFAGIAILLGVYSTLGIIGGLLIATAGGYWLFTALKQFTKLTPSMWGKKVFLTSLLVMLVMSFCLALGPLVA